MEAHVRTAVTIFRLNSDLAKLPGDWGSNLACTAAQRGTLDHLPQRGLAESSGLSFTM